MENETLRLSIARDLVPDLSPEGFGSCPGRSLHGSRDGAKDFRVCLDGAPTASCFHGSCAAVVDDFNLELRRQIARAESDGVRQRPMLGDVAAEPKPSARCKRPPFDPEKLATFARRCRERITPEWLRSRSPMAITQEQGTATATLFLDAIYQPGERVLVFTTQTSQGDFLHEPGHGSFRLGKEPGVHAVPSVLPEGGREGVWFLANPVCGTWEPNRNRTLPDGSQALGRRHGACVTSWRFLVLESDVATETQWLAALVQLPLPIVAAYTSGGKSVHSLIRLDADSKTQWDAQRDALMPVLCVLGGDPAAMTAVRLSRLPGCLRYGTRGPNGLIRYDEPRLQRLLWLNPEATAMPIIDSV